VKTLALLSILAAGLPLAAAAEPLDTTKAMRCALAQAAECDEKAECSAVDLVAAEIPDIWRVDFATKQLASDDGKRTSPIAAVETLDAVLVLQGHQNGRGWTLVIDRATGHLAGTVADVDGSFVLAGGCSVE
jgi:hypothetical protein